MRLPRIAKDIPRSNRKPNPRRQAEHLAFIRMLPCIACGRSAPSQAAHVRSGTDGGVGLKPHDKFSTPMCAACHAKQHKVGELTFWSALGIDPLDTAYRLWTISGNLEAGARLIFRARQQIALKGLSNHDAEFRSEGES
jgi:hypothetical protein